jgi:hypothetical protein
MKSGTANLIDQPGSAAEHLKPQKYKNTVPTFSFPAMASPIAQSKKAPCRNQQQ